MAMTFDAATPFTLEAANLAALRSYLPFEDASIELEGAAHIFNPIYNRVIFQDSEENLFYVTGTRFGCNGLKWSTMLHIRHAGKGILKNLYFDQLVWLRDGKIEALSRGEWQMQEHQKQNAPKL